MITDIRESQQKMLDYIDDQLKYYKQYKAIEISKESKAKEKMEKYKQELLNRVREPSKMKSYDYLYSWKYVESELDEERNIEAWFNY